MSEIRSSQGQAPGRIDVLGGVADYSGSLVLETPVQGQTSVSVAEIPAKELLFQFHEPASQFSLPAEEFMAAIAAGLPRVSLFLREINAPEPVFYVAGCLAVLLEARELRPISGLEFTVTSTVPQSMGVSSSAALEVATMRALAAHFGVEYFGTELARLAQRAENIVVGAPCGLMDQLSSAYGVAGSLLPILCRPDILLEPVALPEGVMAVGWPSGVKHSVSGSGYGTARAATFMGKQLFERLTGRTWAHAAEITPGYFLRHAQGELPRQVTGAEFLAEFGEVADSLSRIQAETVYPIYDALRFPIEENQRAATAVALLRALTSRNQAEHLRLIGELMYASHAGYGSIGLGCPETDAMVGAVEALGNEAGFYGARVSGGGCGGTVVVLLDRASLPQLDELRRSLVFAEDGVPLPLIW